MTKLRLFTISVLVTTIGMLAVMYVQRPKHPGANHPVLVPVADKMFVTSQLWPEGVHTLKLHQISTIVDIRPDGEARDQASSSEIELAAKKNGLNFHYIPVPHETIPDDAVTALSGALAGQTVPAVLYCRTGRRAVRLFALVEAGRADGPGSDDILEMVRSAGFTAEDLKENIARRIAGRNRNNIPEVNH